MKVLLVNGSPHQDGCTNLALEEIAKTLQKEDIQTEIIWLGNKAISGCIACNSCINNEGKCFINDEVNNFIQKAKESDGFVFGSPVHFASASGTLTSFLDRIFYGKGKIFRGKAYASVVSCRRGGATATFDQINKYALMNNMYVVGSSYWNQIHGTNKQEAMQDLEGLQTMRNLARNMSFLIKSIKNSKFSKPEIETEHKTNFI